MTSAQIRKYTQCSFVLPLPRHPSCSLTHIFTFKFYSYSCLFVLYSASNAWFLNVIFVTCKLKLLIFFVWKRDWDHAHIHTELSLRLYWRVYANLSTVVTLELFEVQNTCDMFILTNGKHQNQRENIHFFAGFVYLVKNQICVEIQVSWIKSWICIRVKCNRQWKPMF